MRPDLIHTRGPYWKHPVGKVSVFFLSWPNVHSSTYMQRWEAAGRFPQSGWQPMMGFLSATASILSELDESACQRQREECGWFSLAVGCLRETHPPSPQRRRRRKKASIQSLHKSVHDSLRWKTWSCDEAGDKQQPTGLPLLLRSPVQFQANQWCSYVRCD